MFITWFRAPFSPLSRLRLSKPSLTKRSKEQSSQYQGQVVIVGAGPGDAELLTIKAFNMLQQADIVLFDALVHHSVLDIIPAKTKREFVGKRSGRHSISQADIGHRLVRLASEGLKVVRLKGGDPAIFARTCEESTVLEQANIPFAIIPGITAASGASAYTGIPLTDRRCASSLTLLTAHCDQPERDPDWPAIAKRLSNETIGVYMGLSRLPSIVAQLSHAGVVATFPVAVIENACCDEQKLIIGNLSDIVDQVTRQCLTGPALLIFGEVVKFRQSVSPSLVQSIQHVSTI